jgi:hypothetical protein
MRKKMIKKIDVSFIEKNETILDEIFDELEKNKDLVIHLYDGEIFKAVLIPYDTYNKTQNDTKN